MPPSPTLITHAANAMATTRLSQARRRENGAGAQAGAQTAGYNSDEDLWKESASQRTAWELVQPDMLVTPSLNPPTGGKSADQSKPKLSRRIRKETRECVERGVGTSVRIPTRLPTEEQQLWDAIDVDAREATEVESMVETDTESSPSPTPNVSFAFSNALSYTTSVTSFESVSSSSSIPLSARKRAFDYTNTFARPTSPVSPTRKFRKINRQATRRMSPDIPSSDRSPTSQFPPPADPSDLFAPTRPQKPLTKASALGTEDSVLHSGSGSVGTGAPPGGPPLTAGSSTSVPRFSKARGFVSAAISVVHAVAHPGSSSPRASTSSVASRHVSASSDGQYCIIAHSRDIQTMMDELQIAWGVQYELARGVSLGRWSWSDVTREKLNSLKGNNHSAAPRVHVVMRSSGIAAGVPRGFDNTLWAELDREQDAIIENSSRGLGLQGPWQDDSKWYGGKIQQIARLVKVEDPTESPFQLRLERMDKGKSHRFARFLGSRRLLQVNIPQKLLYDPKTQESLQRFLLQRFVLCGRVFVPFHRKDGKVFLMESMEDYERQASDFQGDQHRITLLHFIRWHNSVELNMKQPTNKWITRFDLGFSVSVPALQFRKEDVIEIPDVFSSAFLTGKKPPAEFCFTDGCGFMNGAALSQIAKHIGYSERPTALQGRVAGAKGLWALHPTDQHPLGTPKIWIRPSQLKIKHGDLGSHPAHLIFDLVAPPRVTTPSRLSKYTIMNLSHNKVPVDVFVALMRDGLQKEIEDLTRWKNPVFDLILLTHAVSQAGGVSGAKLQRMAQGSSRALGISGRDFDDSESEDDAEEDSEGSSAYLARDEYSGQPASTHETVLDLLNAGFNPLRLPLLYDKLKKIIKARIEAFIQEYHITVARSAEAFIIPDPCDPPVLEEGQIHFKCTQHLKDPLEDVSPNILTGDVLIYRNPARVPSDIQKVTAIAHPRLSEYVNVIVMPRKGGRSMASLLAGGDYDGDVCVCIWEPTIVEPFRNPPLNLPQDNFDEMNFEASIASVQDLHNKTKNMPPMQAQLELQKTLVSGFTDAGVGLYSKFHENTSYALGYDHPETLRFAFMFAKVLDSRKTGLKVKRDVFKADKQKYDRPQPPCMQSKKAAEQSFGGFHVRRRSKSPFVLDQLLDAGRRIEEDHLQRYDKLRPDNFKEIPDPDLLKPYLDAVKFVTMLKERGIDAGVQELDAIKAHISRHCDQFRTLAASFDPQTPSKSRRPGAAKARSADWRALARSFAQDPQGIVWLQTQLTDIKASYAYYRSPKMAFQVAFQTLCRLKVGDRGVTMTREMAGAYIPLPGLPRVISPNREG